MAVTLTQTARFAQMAEEARRLVQRTEIAYSVACVSLGVVDTRRALLANATEADNERMDATRTAALELLECMRLELAAATRTLAAAEQRVFFSALDDRRISLPILPTDATLAQKRAHLANLSMLVHDYALYILKARCFRLTSYADNNDAVTITFVSERLLGGSRWTVFLDGTVRAQRAQPSDKTVDTFCMLTSPACAWLPSVTLGF